jgi:2-alkyl-3-oxoalkanoate reductase
VFHAAALSAPWGKREEFFAANVTGTRNVIQACLKHQVSKLVYVSSPSVIFDNNDQINVDESVPYAKRFLSLYSLTKKLAEDLVNDARKELAVVIVRPKAIFGPGDNALLSRLIAAARGHRLRQIGNGKNLVDLTYVDNVVHALLLASETQWANGKTYHITNGEHVPLWPLLRRVLTNAGCAADLAVAPFSVAYGLATLMEWNARRTGVEPLLTRYTVGILGRTQTYNINAARQDLGYEPLVSIDEGIERTLAHIREQMNVA